MAAFYVPNSALAKFCLGLTTALFLYYFLWVSVVPFLLIDEENWIYSLFPPLSYAFIVPVTCGTMFIASLAGYTIYQVRNYAEKVKSKTQ